MASKSCVVTAVEVPCSWSRENHLWVDAWIPRPDPLWKLDVLVGGGVGGGLVAGGAVPFGAERLRRARRAVTTG